ncbi:MAG: hypothetical protein IKT60_00320 [Clostridia bacterium]|nr:hypothetical protein [Clostridia bacterium]
MNRSALKNVVLILLLLVNFAAAAVLIHRFVSERAAAAELAAAAENYLRQCGVTVTDGILSGHSESYEIVRLSPDLSREVSTAAALLGTAERHDSGAGNVEFTSERGTLRLGAGGEIEADLAADPALAVTSPAAARRAVLELLGRALDLSSAEAEAETADGGFAVTVRDTLAETPIENGELTVRLQADGSLSLRGCWRLGSVSAELDSGSRIQASAVAQYVSSCGGSVPFQKITGIRLVYWLYPEASGDLSIIPAYRLATDRGEVVLDAITAERLK